MTKRTVIILLASVFFIIGCAMMGTIMSDVEQPNYDVLSSTGKIEIRQYDPMIIAEVRIEGERVDAIGEGFRLLADYVFGNNRAQQDIAMTAPVEQQAESVNIAMTAPVQQQSIAEEGIWKVSFVMPSQYTMATLPLPRNDRVRLTEVAATQYIVIQFSGRNTHDNIAKHEAQLMEYIDAENISVIGAPKYAFYNPPWTLPLLRRNEVMIAVDSTGK